MGSTRKARGETPEARRLSPALPPSRLLVFCSFRDAEEETLLPFQGSAEHLLMLYRVLLMCQSIQKITLACCGRIARRDKSRIAPKRLVEDKV